MSYRPYYNTQAFSPRPQGFFSHLPPVVSTLIKVNVGIFFAVWLLHLDAVANLFALSWWGIKHGFLWQPLTYGFLHGSFGHLFFNMLTLFFLGPETERAMGSRHFLAMYLLSGVLGGLGWIWLSADPRSVCVGASGSIYGMLAAFATLYPRRQLTVLLFFIFPVTLMAWQLVAGLAILEFFFAGNQASGIAHTAHLAGAFAGFLYIDQLFENTLLRKLWQRARDYAAQRPARPAPPPPPAPDQAEVDRILDKITAQGIQSLTQAERQTLHRASRTF